MEKENEMRVLLPAIVIAALGTAASAQAQPQGRYYPWCAWYDDWTYNCGFQTVGQCWETISGVGGVCRPNPYPAPPESRRPRRAPPR